MTEYIKSGQGALFLQPGGPGTPLYYLGCHSLGDVDAPKGDLTLRYCPDPSAPNKWKVVSSWRGAPGPVTTSLEVDITETADWLEKVNCPANLYVLQNSCGRMDNPLNYARGFLFSNSQITNEGLTGLVAKDPDSQDQAVMTFDISAEELFRVFEFDVATQGIGETEDLTDIAFGGRSQCSGPCGANQELCDFGVVVGKSAAGSPSNLATPWITTDGGDNWAASATQPFASSEDISSVVVFDMDKDTRRIMVARGTTDAGNPAEIAYSDDSGATWTNVNVGSTNGQYVLGPNGLIALDRYHLWLVTTGGYIYFSSDGGATWITQDAGLVTSNNLYAVDFIDDNTGFAVGVSDTILYTLDGGANWTTASATGSGDDILSVAVHDRYVVWVSTSGGEMWRTSNGGTTWTEYTGFSGTGTGSIPAQSWFNQSIGAFIHNTAAPVGSLHFTIDGGQNWRSVPLPGSNVGLTSVFICDPQTLYVTGNAVGGSGLIYKAFA